MVNKPADIDLTCVDLTKLSVMTRFKLQRFLSDEELSTRPDPEDWPYPPTSAAGVEMYAWSAQLRGICRALQVLPDKSGETPK